MTRPGAVEIKAGRRKVEITHADRELFGNAGVTKAVLARYYVAVAERMLPHVDGRPVHIRAYPHGIEADGFVHKSVGRHYPDWIGRAELPKREGGTIEQVVPTDAATLAYLAGQNGISIHGWLSRADRLESPDLLILDLDPTGDDFGEVREAARTVRAVLERLGLPAYLKTTGSRGLHLVTPLDRSDNFETTHRLARGIATLAAREDPDALTVETRKAQRGDRLFVDYLRNGYAQTAVVPYSVRARPGAPVAMPISWDELDTTGPQDFTVTAAAEWLDRADPWEGMRRHAHRAARALEELERIL